VHLQSLVDHEAGAAVVHVLPVQTLLVEVQIGVISGLLSNFGGVSCDVEGEGSETLDIDGLSSY